MQRETISYPSLYPNATIEGFFFHPTNPVRAQVIIVHGMNEHIGRYKELAEFLTAQGIAVCGNNYLGHGNSLIGGLAGYLGEKNQIECLLHDLGTMREIAIKRYPDIPVFIFGHSMGSFITRHYITKHSEGLCGAIFCATGGTNHLATFFGAPLTFLLTKLKGAAYKSKMVDKLFYDGLRKPFKSEKSASAWLTSDDSELGNIDKDKNMRNTFTVSAYNTLFTLVTKVSSTKWARKIHRNLPILIISGENDSVGNFGVGPQEVNDILLKSGVKDVTLKLFSDMRHEIVHESEKERVFDFLSAWFNRYLD